MKSRTPKVLHRLCGREMLSLVVDAAGEAGFSPTVVVVPTESAAIRQVLGDRAIYVEQAQPLGSGHAVLQARESLDGVDSVAVLHGDVPLVRPLTLSHMMRSHLETEASITLLAAQVDSPDGLGRLVRDGTGRITAIVEEGDTDDGTGAIKEVNGGVYCFQASWLWDNIGDIAPSSSGEIYLTDLVSRAAVQGIGLSSFEAADTEEILGVNTRVQLAEAEAALQRRLRNRWMMAGVTMTEPGAVYLDCSAELGEDTVVLPNTYVRGASRIGRDCEIGPNTIIDNCAIGDGCQVVASVLDGCTLEDGVHVGPFSHIRHGSYLESGVHIGSGVEVKESRFRRGARSGHFSYIGDADVGANANIGAGTVTCNFDGQMKHRTIIGEGAFIGSDTMLVAPVSIGARATTGAGAVVTRDVPPDSLAKGVPARAGPRKPPVNTG